ncbi:MAG: sensor histidine kinase [Bacteroidia bacterium]|nr:sensor histidine kinase [Bacteroidia bacterium]
MPFKKIINSIVNIGVREMYAPWEIHLTRKLNSILLIAIFNVSLAIVVYSVLGYNDFLIDLISVVVLGPLLFLFNKYFNYVWAAYWFFIVGYVFFISINLKMGKDSYMLLFYFPVVLSLVQLLGRRELLKHLIFLGILCIISVSIIAIGFIKNWVPVLLNQETLNNIMILNIILSVFTAVAFVIVVVTESISQERLINKMLSEKEILLSEVFHRVKNNMNIVTSLLSLKKNNSDSAEVRDALEECRSRVFSMALVHHKIFERENVVDLNFKNYIHDLMIELKSSFDHKGEVDIIIDAEEFFIELSNAIPCGLILNEFVTNSFKYAQLPDRKLKIHISLQKQNDCITLELRDNGPGFQNGVEEKVNTLGVELMKSLSEQINGNYHFKNDNGLLFQLKFKQG